MTQTTSVPTSASARVIADLAYAPPDPPTSLGHLLDLYLPVGASSPAPLIIWSAGSGWMVENGREGAAVVAQHLTPHGFAVAGVAIRSSAHAQFPAQLHDIKAAIRWLRANATQYHLDPARFGIMGDSSGGWAAAMAGVTGDIPELEGEVGVLGGSSRVHAVLPFYPPTDFLQMDAHMLEDCVPFNRMLRLTQCHADPRSPESRLVGGPIQARPDAVRRANPATYARPDVPPFLILHGQRDLMVPSHQSEVLYESLATAGADATLVLLPHGEHGQWNGFLTDPALRAGAIARSAQGRQRQPEQPVELSWDTVVRFFDRHLRHQ